MKNVKIIKIVAGIIFGAGVGICVGVATQNALSGILIGLGLALCMAVSFNSYRN